MFTERKGIVYLIEEINTQKWVCMYFKEEYTGSDFSGKTQFWKNIPKIDGQEVTSDAFEAICWDSFEEAEKWRVEMVAEPDKFVVTEHIFGD